MKPIMTKTKALEWLKAVISLREYYEGKNNFHKNWCPLCPIGRLDTFCRSESNCKLCLWVIFEKQIYCPDFAANNRIYKSKEWVALSIPRLKRWERRLKRIIAKNKEHKA